MLDSGDMVSDNHSDHAGTIRDNSMDLLRLLSCFAIVLIHVNAQYFIPRSVVPSLASVYIIESLINIITRFSVPAFVMISGAFVLGNRQNANAQQFYIKTLRKIYLPLLPPVVFFIADDKLSKGIGLSWIFKMLLNGTYYNLWFMFMILFLYALVPVCVRLKTILPKKWWGRLGFAILAWAIVSQATSTYELSYDIGVIASYLGYFITGNFLYENHRRLRLPSTPVCLLMIATLIATTFLVRYLGFSYYLFDQYKSFFSPTILAISLLVFIVFCRLQVQINLRGAAFLTYYVYVFHTIVYSSLIQILGDAQHELRTIALISLLTIVVSFAISLIYSALWHLLFKRPAQRTR